MSFEKLTSFTKKVADLADRPTLSPYELKNQFDAAPDEVRVYLNKLIDALNKTVAGDSGAKNIGASSISGITGNDIQTILEYIASNYVRNDATGTTAAMYRENIVLSPSVLTKILFDEKFTDSGNIANKDTGRFTVPKNGYYLISASAVFYIEAGKGTSLVVFRNGVSYRTIGVADATGAGYQQVGTTEVFQFNQGDYIELYLYQSGVASQTAKNIKINMSLI
jgi:C1q domain